ncbi:MFS transporter [Acetobacter sp. DmW_136]|uniref:MFS transporter n=1 Tax=Acetobacter sp. DmW_136 TaxID=2591091 RepID=UPI00123A8F0A|nr:MFS transporter [Acetobacter sp. DmW_136]KAA8387783.1 MFS transporter [Acetobacter sp. DmW_136]
MNGNNNIEGAPDTAGKTLWSIFAIVVFTLLCYVEIGLQMAVVPLFVKEQLGFSSALAGFAVSVQYLATFISRVGAGRRIDTRGPKRVVIAGLFLGALSGLFIMLAPSMMAWPVGALAIVLLGRIFLGISESWVATGVIVWNIQRVGAPGTARVISWNGVCSYGGIALGAPIAMMIYQSHAALGGFWGIGLCCMLMLLLGVPWAWHQVAVKPLSPSTGKRHSFMTVFGQVAPYGMALAAGSIGFGAISSLLTLYFADQNWSGAATALSIFGCVFVLTRFGFTTQITKRGGTIVALVSLLIESLGLCVLAMGHSPVWANIGAALTGAGFSLLFPALGVGAVARTKPENKGIAVGAFSVFLDIALGLSGPVLGFIIPFWGYQGLFLTTALMSLIGVGICAFVYRKENGQSILP